MSKVPLRFSQHILDAEFISLTLVGDVELSANCDPMDHSELRDLRILVIDDSDFIRKQLKTAFETLIGFNVIGKATTGDEGVQMARTLRPDLIVLEPSMAGTNGVEVLRNIRQYDQRVLIVVFTADYSAVMRDVYREAGATFFVSKARVRDLLEVSELARKIS